MIHSIPHRMLFKDLGNLNLKKSYLTLFFAPLALNKLCIVTTAVWFLCIKLLWVSSTAFSISLSFKSSLLRLNLNLQKDRIILDKRSSTYSFKWSIYFLVEKPRNILWITIAAFVSLSVISLRVLIFSCFNCFLIILLLKFKSIGFITIFFWCTCFFENCESSLVSGVNGSRLLNVNSLLAQEHLFVTLNIL